MTTSNRERRAREAATSRRMSALISGAIAVFIIAALGIFGVSSFAQRETHLAETGNASSSAILANKAKQSSGAMHEITDSEGRSVSVPENPQAIACFDSFAGEMALLAGAGSRVMGVPGGVKSDVLLQEKFPGLSDVEQLSGNSVNIEALMSAGCDVALVRPTLSDTERAKLAKANIPFVVVSYTDVPSQIEGMRVVGAACGGEAVAAAEKLANFASETVALIAERVKGADSPRVYHAINNALTCDGTGSLGADWIARVGCVPVSAGEGTDAGTGGNGDYQATLEQIYAWNPDFIICNSSSVTSEFKTQERWKGMRAVSEGRVLQIPIGATRWGQRGSVETFLGMLWLAFQVHPDLFADLNFHSMVVDYYRDYVGLTISEYTWNKMLDGSLRSEGGGSGSGTGGGGGAGSGSGTGGGGGGGNGGVR